VYLCLKATSSHSIPSELVCDGSPTFGLHGRKTATSSARLHAYQLARQRNLLGLVSRAGGKHSSGLMSAIVSNWLRSGKLGGETYGCLRPWSGKRKNHRSKRRRLLLPARRKARGTPGVSLAKAGTSDSDRGGNQASSAEESKESHECSTNTSTAESSPLRCGY